MKAKLHDRRNALSGTGRPAFERLVKIAGRFREGEPVNQLRLAEEMEVSSKTIYRDFEFLRDRFMFDIEYNRTSHAWELIDAPEARLI